MMRLAIFCVALGLATAAAAARDIHVNNLGGSDLFDGSRSTSEAGIGGPTRSIAKALRLARAGDHVVVANTGVAYREMLSLTGSRHSGWLLGPFVVDGGGATLDGSAPVDPDSWTYVADDVFAFRPARLAYQQLFVNARQAVRHPARPNGLGLPALEPLEWCYRDARIYFRVETGRLPENYELACCALQTGITLYHVEDVVVRNFVIQGFAVDGLCARRGPRRAAGEHHEPRQRPQRHHGGRRLASRVERLPIGRQRRRAIPLRGARTGPAIRVRSEGRHGRPAGDRGRPRDDRRAVDCKASAALNPATASGRLAAAR